MQITTMIIIMKVIMMIMNKIMIMLVKQDLISKIKEAIGVIMEIQEEITDKHREKGRRGIMAKPMREINKMDKMTNITIRIKMMEKMGQIMGKMMMKMSLMMSLINKMLMDIIGRKVKQRATKIKIIEIKIGIGI